MPDYSVSQEPSDHRSTPTSAAIVPLFDPQSADRTTEELRRTIVELKAAQSRLIEQERLRALGQMASGIAHDFNNALSPILGFSEVMLKNPAILADQDRVRRYLETIKTAAMDAS